MLSGTFRADRHSLSKLPIEVPPCPGDLSATAKEYWDDITDKLEAAGMIAAIDGMALRIFCESAALYVKAMAELDKGLVIQTTNGNWVQNPHLSIRNKLGTALLATARQFGMTASSRNGLSFDVSDGTDDPIADLLNRREGKGRFFDGRKHVAARSRKPQ